MRQEKDDQKIVLEDKDLEVIGSPIIKYGDSTVIVQHAETGTYSLKFNYYLTIILICNNKILFKVYGLAIKAMKQKKKELEKLKKNKQFFMKREKWTMD